MTIAHTFTQALLSICQSVTSRLVHEINLFSPHDLTRVSTWNSAIFKTPELCIHHMIEQQVCGTKLKL